MDLPTIDHLAVGVSMGVVKFTAAMLEYNAWALSIGIKYREHVRTVVRLL